MIDLARQGPGDDADLYVADLSAPLPFVDAEFDDAVASLVLPNVQDWSGPLAELRHVPKPSPDALDQPRIPRPTTLR